jgi:deoxyribose-phosphate aldolase
MTRHTVDAVMAEARAASFRTRSIKTFAKLAGLRLALSMVDLTTLEGKDSPEKVRALCRKAVRPGDLDDSLPHVAAVCVYPSLVKIAKEELAGSGVKVASVATGFPSGQYPLAVRLADVAQAIRDGADEIDMVINRGAFLSGRYAEVAEEIARVQEVCVAGPPGDGGAGGGGGAHLKVILETGELETYDNVRRASDLAIQAMADPSGDCRGGFIKTSTGKVTPAATMPVTLVMLEAIRDHFLATGHMVGMKPAGGIRSAKESLHYLVMVKETLGDAWLTPDWFRFGASTLVNDLLRQIARHGKGDGAGRYAARYDFSEA